MFVCIYVLWELSICVRTLPFVLDGSGMLPHSETQTDMSLVFQCVFCYPTINLKRFAFYKI